MDDATVLDTTDALPSVLLCVVPSAPRRTLPKSSSLLSKQPSFELFWEKIRPPCKLRGSSARLKSTHTSENLTKISRRAAAGNQSYTYCQPQPQHYYPATPVNAQPYNPR